jgi:Aspartyl/Asparaginyl beta-hydroxylase
MRQAIYKRHEIPIADELMSLKQALTDEFMSGFNSLQEAADSDQCTNVISVDRQDIKSLGEIGRFLTRQNSVTREWEPDLSAWRAVGFKFTRDDDVKPVRLKITEEEAKKFPTAYALMKKYDDAVPMMSYNVLAPRTILHRHMGPENLKGEFVRIHIPLIIPPGDLFLEVFGEEITWDDIFAFDNTLLHSAHNYSEFYRLVLLFDINRKAIGMPAGEPYDKELEKTTKPFVRGWNE